MSQTTEIQIQNQAGLPFRQKLNLMLSALNTVFSGTTAPTVTEAGMFWLDTSTVPPTLRRRNASDTAWTIAPIVEGVTNSSTAKTTPVDADTLPLVDSAASNSLKKLLWADIKATLKTYFDGLYLKLSGGTLTGVLTLAADPTNALEAATKQYVDNNGGGAQIQSVTASVTSNALTLTLDTTKLDFRSGTLASGAVNRRTLASPISVTIPSGATLGTINNQSARLAVLAIDNAGTVELAAVNLAGGVNLDETTLLNTIAVGTAASFTGSIAASTGLLTVSAVSSGAITLGMAISGSGIPQGTVITGFGTGTGGTGTYNTNYTTAVASTAMTGVAGYGIYSSAARSSVPFRVVGFIDITETTAGTWASAPTRIQGAGALSTAGWNGIGYGQTWQAVTGSRAFGTTYYNATGRPITVYVVGQYNGANFATFLTVGGVQVWGTAQGISGGYSVVSVVIPPSASYVGGASNSGALAFWYELR